MSRSTTETSNKQQPPTTPISAVVKLNYGPYHRAPSSKADPLIAYVDLVLVVDGDGELAKVFPKEIREEKLQLICGASVAEVAVGRSKIMVHGAPLLVGAFRHKNLPKSNKQILEAYFRELEQALSAQAQPGTSLTLRVDSAASEGFLVSKKHDPARKQIVEDSLKYLCLPAQGKDAQPVVPKSKAKPKLQQRAQVEVPKRISPRQVRTGRESSSNRAAVKVTTSAV